MRKEGISDAGGMRQANCVCENEREVTWNSFNFLKICFNFGTVGDWSFRNFHSNAMRVHARLRVRGTCRNGMDGEGIQRQFQRISEESRCFGMHYPIDYKWLQIPHE